MADDARFTWVEAYEAIASELLNRRGQEPLLLDICSRHANLDGVERMDPLTFMAAFNRRQKDSTREGIVKDVLSSFGIASVDPPRDFTGIPVSDPRRWRYMDGLDESIGEKWDFFEAALAYADSGQGADIFAALFDAVLKQKNIGRASLTSALYWCRPNAFIALDANTVRYLGEAYSVSVPSQVDGQGYLSLLQQIRSATNRPFPELSTDAYGSDAWLPLPEVYDPGLTTEDWAELIKDVDVFTHDTMTMLSRMAELGGQATCKEMSEAFGEHPSHYVSLGGTLGEKVVEKAGIPAEVKSDGKEQFWSIPFLGRSAAKGQPGTFCWKIRPELYDALMIDGVLPDAHAESGSEPACPHAGDSANQSELYSDADFLAEVYMDAGDFEDLKGLAKAKRNIILQGAPGTGKTFAAERLAWALMGCKDKARVERVQFHQSTSYDEFVIGFRPNTQGGFAIEEGPFVRLCDRAAADAGNEYFLIIDEVNRANVSKVFGELLMLIEDSHRGEELLLTAGKRMFSVPKNLTIIGMMNTADRGLALIDYALRRRFAFFEMEPALDNSAFKERVEACLDKRMPALVEAVRKLNAKIADDPTLGEGFRIGHSYFCRDKEKEPGCVDAIVKYELVPLVREYWFDDRKTAEAKVAKLEALL